MYMPSLVCPMCGWGIELVELSPQEMYYECNTCLTQFDLFDLPPPNPEDI
ncbi:hypothetical protein UFOVP1_7 [uncultured Caudovirales phage]|uniref:Uncharacterized protein n=1 Tax=uncultured Caudovirales phage TaxID=2100421 RepID=A0A6J5KH59_9CAUD|nr:hypothetical protein UFOVP1_7 [uncultured Caudovirales phage]